MKRLLLILALAGCEDQRSCRDRLIADLESYKVTNVRTLEESRFNVQLSETVLSLLVAPPTFDHCRWSVYNGRLVRK